MNSLHMKHEHGIFPGLTALNLRPAVVVVEQAIPRQPIFTDICAPQNEVRFITQQPISPFLPIVPALKAALSHGSMRKSTQTQEKGSM